MLKLLYACILGFVALTLTGCAAFNNLTSEVSTYGLWPAERKPASFVFERLPSQQVHPERQEMLENAARGAVEAAGFRAAQDPADAQYLIQIGARVSASDPWIYNEPLFLRFGYAYPYACCRFRRQFGPLWGPWYDDYVTFDREVAVLIRDHKNGQLLYEARASNSGSSPSMDYLLPAMFTAAMRDFPANSPNPHDISVQISVK
jgi:Domain of unknown function (DUF4136)